MDPSVVVVVHRKKGALRTASNRACTGRKLLEHKAAMQSLSCVFERLLVLVKQCTKCLGIYLVHSLEFFESDSDAITLRCLQNQ